MKPRFLADADFNQKIVLGFLRREPTIDFQTASQGDIIGRPDPQVLAIAARENRILISHDRGTMPAHFTRFTATQSSPGLILVSQEIEIGTAIEELLKNCCSFGLRRLMRSGETKSALPHCQAAIAQALLPVA